jgi:putative ABC transport system permease protein
LIRLVIGGGTIPVLVGIAAGLGGSMALGRFIESILYATKPIDAPTLVAVSAILLAVALAACFVPAWRAAKVDPMTTLRQE